ncbi:methionine biosynthesis protein MetW [Maricurvus nonylphenolicus]|uniref:methionine biosynthesis protein MetW n=1 Tax=Maricurvus nonylphenolicus TaxID=1008307 RepID=UPI0036F3484E
MRRDLDVIQRWIAPGSRVLDLGCGDGTLLANLRDNKQVNGYGLEISPDQITTCIGKGLNVIDQNLNDGLDNFADKSFDVVVMTQALQTMHAPHEVLKEMLRVGKECIVTFPNFGHWKARWHLASRGRMPVSDLLPYEWYDTPNIHFCTFKDFEILCRDLGIRIQQRQVVAMHPVSRLLKGLRPNLFGDTAIYHLSQ